jgi:hypothetical protein
MTLPPSRSSRPSCPTSRATTGTSGLSVHTGLGSGTLLQSLYRLENWGWRGDGAARGAVQGPAVVRARADGWCEQGQQPSYCREETGRSARLSRQEDAGEGTASSHSQAHPVWGKEDRACASHAARGRSRCRRSRAARASLRSAGGDLEERTPRIEAYGCGMIVGLVRRMPPLTLGRTRSARPNGRNACRLGRRYGPTRITAIGSWTTPPWCWTLAADLALTSPVWVCAERSGLIPRSRCVGGPDNRRLRYARPPPRPSRSCRCRSAATTTPPVRVTRIISATATAGSATCCSTRSARQPSTTQMPASRCRISASMKASPAHVSLAPSH